MRSAPRDRVAYAVCAYAVAVAICAVAYWAWGRPDEPVGEQTLAWLGWLRGRRVAPRHAVAIADSLAVGGAALSALVFLAWLHIAGWISRRWVFAALLVAGALLRLHIAIQDPVGLRRWPLDDDSHYYFNIAYHLAHGEGLKHDSFNATTGVQPLFLALITPIYWVVDDKLLAVNGVMVMQVAIGLLFAWVLSSWVRVVAGDLASLLAVALWAFSRYFVSIDLNGLETTLSLTSIGSVALYYSRLLEARAPPGRRQIVALGVLLGVAFLARTDNGLLAAAVAIHWLVANPWGGRRRAAWVDVSQLAAVTSLIALPWLAVNLVLVGSVLPGGGQAVRFLSVAYGFKMFGATGPAFELQSIPFDYYLETLRAGVRELYGIALDIAPPRPALAFILIGTMLSPRTVARTASRLGWFGFFAAFLFLAYTTYIFGQWYFHRYWAPLALAGVLLLAIGLHGWQVRFEARAGWRRLFEATLVAGLAVSLLSDIGGAIHTPHRVERGFLDAANWINENTPEDAVIGGFQTGIFGYYLERRFYGLDGKINIDALDALRVGQIDAYVQARGIEYLADWPFVLDSLFVGRSSDPGYLSRQTRVYANRDVVVYRLGPYTHPPTDTSKDPQ